MKGFKISKRKLRGRKVARLELNRVTRAVDNAARAAYKSCINMTQKMNASRGYVRLAFWNHRLATMQALTAPIGAVCRSHAKGMRYCRTFGYGKPHPEGLYRHRACTNCGR